MDVINATAIETAEREYLRARVRNVAQIEGNPYGARIFANGAFPCFQVKAAPSPMFNRIHGDVSAEPQAMVDLLQQNAAYSVVTPLFGAVSSLEPFMSVAGRRLERLKGWTHMQLACAIEHATLGQHAFDIQEATPQSLLAFTEVHASGFHTKPAQRAASQASFGNLHTNDALKIYVIQEADKVVAGASLYLASNGVAYLGTAVTQKGMRGRGFHAALIAHRIAQAREQGAVTVAATALASSQSRRNLQRAGLHVSHAQSLYRLLEN